jgi:glutathione S-transferase
MNFMITVYGEGRGFRVVWLLEEMGLPYQLRDVNLLQNLEKEDPEFLKINPAGFIPALDDGDVRMVESIAIMQYLTARYGPSPLAPELGEPAYPTYLQFMMMGEAGLSNPMYYYTNMHRIVPEADRSARFDSFILYQFESRLDLIRRQLEQKPYVAGDHFTAADISVTYALENARRGAGYEFAGAVKDYLARMTAREGYHRAMAACPATRSWEERSRRERAR